MSLMRPVVNIGVAVVSRISAYGLVVVSHEQVIDALAVLVLFVLEFVRDKVNNQHDNSQ